MIVIGVGNDLRGDDAAGLHVARRVRLLDSGLDVRERSGALAALLDDWDEATAVVVIDAMRSGAPAGTIARFDASAGPLPAGVGGATSSHALGLHDVVELARALDRLPARLVVVGIEGASFDAGAPPTAAVAAAIDAAAHAVCREARGAAMLSADPHAPLPRASPGPARHARRPPADG